MNRISAKARTHDIPKRESIDMIRILTGPSVLTENSGPGTGIRAHPAGLAAKCVAREDAWALPNATTALGFQGTPVGMAGALQLSNHSPLKLDAIPSWLLFEWQTRHKTNPSLALSGSAVSVRLHAAERC